jgi:hypothetical protein
LESGLAHFFLHVHTRRVCPPKSKARLRYSAEGKVDQEASTTAVARAFAMSALATAKPRKAMEAAQQAAVLAVAAAKQAAAEKQEKEANQAKEEVVVDEEQEAAAATDDSHDEVDGMSAMEYIMTYRELPPFEVELIMGRPVQCTPFADTEEYKALIADPSTTQEDIDVASDKHKEHLNTRIRFHD